MAYRKTFRRIREWGVMKRGWIESKGTSSIREKRREGRHNSESRPGVLDSEGPTKPKACATGRTNQATKELELE